MVMKWIFGDKPKKATTPTVKPAANSPLVSQSSAIKPVTTVNKDALDAKKRRSRLDAAIDGE